jgi:hypothetical protein
VARLNITAPDELYERLERHRESLNLVLRLQRTHERWYERGWHDGRAWAAERASPLPAAQG